MPELIPAVPGSPEWRIVRATGVTATDIVTILGLSSRDSAYSLYWRKLGQIPEVPDSDRFRLGRELEEYVFTRWLEQSREFRVQFQESALYRHSNRGWQMATLDRRGRTCVVELKTWADADRHSWDTAPPATVRAQVLWQMDVMDVPVGHVGVVFLPSGEFRSYTIEHEDVLHVMGTNRDECKVCFDLDLMRAEGQVFMARLRLELPAPDPDSSAASLAAVRARFAKTPDKTAEVNMTSLAAWSDAKDVLRHWEAKIREYEIDLREQAGEASVLTVDGQPVARRVIVDAQVKAHTRHQDYLKRIKTEADSANGD